MVKHYRFYADCGADIVVGHHTHCISGYEFYGKTPIFYSLGNFLFTMRRENPDSWYTGIVLNLDIDSDKQIRFELLPIEQKRDCFSLNLSSGLDKEKVLNEIDEINSVISNNDLLEQKWDGFIEKNYASFVKRISPIGGIKNRYLKAVFYKTGLYKLFLNQTYLKEFINRIRCEAHFDLTIGIFNKLLK